MPRVRGLDTLRFFLALWVVLGHFGFDNLAGFDKSTLFGRALIAIHHRIFPGPPAVIVFFVISGFCIHFPFRAGQKLQPAPYFSRRYIRILTPMVLAIAIGYALGQELSLLGESILWSLLAEEIYYVLYPGLLAASRRFGWTRVLLVSAGLSLLVALRDPLAGNYTAHGPYLTWLLALPCWLLGCLLAHQVDTLKATIGPVRYIWAWRAGALVLGSTCAWLRFHSPIKYPWTLNLFALFAFLWLKREIVHNQDHAPRDLLERSGRWSYSIYLTHVQAQALFVLLVKPPLAHPLLDWVLQLGFILCATYLFYLLVEKPSHGFARRAAEWLTPRRPSLVP